MNFVKIGYKFKFRQIHFFKSSILHISLGFEKYFILDQNSKAFVSNRKCSNNNQTLELLNEKGVQEEAKSMVGFSFYSPNKDKVKSIDREVAEESRVKMNMANQFDLDKDSSSNAKI